MPNNTVVQNQSHGKGEIKIMKPYYENKDITIWHGDCREILPLIDSNIDLLFTDPPYGIDGGRGTNSKRGKGKYESGLWEDTPEYIKDIVVPFVSDLIINTNRAVITPGKRHMFFYPSPSDIGCFWTPAAIGRGPWGFNSFNPILYYGRDPRAGLGSWPSGKLVVEAPETKEHPCSKPLNAWQWLLAKSCVDTSEIILDPFMGSGTTLRAAKNLGMKAIGIEIEERFCEIAVTRLGQEVMDLGL